MTTPWYQNTNRKPTDFASGKMVCSFSPTLSATLSYGVGRVKDRSEPSFSYLKLGMAAVDAKGNMSPIATHPLGTLGANADLIAAIEGATDTPQVVTLSKALKVRVHRDAEGVHLEFYETPRDEKPHPVGAYICADERVENLVEKLHEARRFIARTMHQADSDEEPSEEQDVFEPSKTVYR
jgi:hypothetical protein